MERIHGKEPAQKNELRKKGCEELETKDYDNIWHVVSFVWVDQDIILYEITPNSSPQRCFNLRMLRC